MKYIMLLLLSLMCICSIKADEVVRDFSKVLKNGKNSAAGRGIFNVIQFPNTGCPGASSNRNGTCFTSSECASKGGTSDGTCANGYGVCCIIKLTCGQSSSQNCTYLTVGSTTTPPQSCVFNLCKCSPSVCRIRLDFNVFDITGPVVGTAGNSAAAFNAAASSTSTFIGNAIGDCTIDSFTVNAPGHAGTPVICGLNTGQHVYVDAASMCSMAAFQFGTFGTHTRQVDIKVTQYVCDDEHGGPDGCLQYFTAPTGTIESFNFPATGNAVTSAATHLSSQNYNMCIRRAAGMCAVCFSPTVIVIGGANAMMQDSFGLSVDLAAIAQGQVDTACLTDYIVIPQAQSAANVVNGVISRGSDRFCGRFFGLGNLATTSSQTLCTTRRPFRITFRTDGDEKTGGSTMSAGATCTVIGVANPVACIATWTTCIANTANSCAANAATDEETGIPSGIVGFSLNYFQLPCTSTIGK